MRIAIFTNAYKPTVSGVVTSIHLFRTGLIQAGHHISVIAPEYGNYTDGDLYVFRVPAIDFSHYVDLTLAIPMRGPLDRTLSGIRPEIIHSQHPLIMGNVAASFARQYKIPLVFTFHTRYEEYAQKYVPFVPQLAGIVMDEVVQRHLDHCNHIIAPTPSIREMILNKYRIKAPISVIPTPVNLSNYTQLDPESVRQRLGLQDAEVLLYVGRLSEEKNLSFLIKSFARVVQLRPTARLVLVGKGVDEADLRRLVEKLGLLHQVIFTGPVPYEHIPHYAAAADLFVFPSKTDTQGLVLVEAMAAGTPVVAVDAPSSRDVLSNGGGLLVPDQLEPFANAIDALLADRPRLVALAEEALALAQTYDIPTAVQRLVDVYQEAIAAYPMMKVKKV